MPLISVIIPVFNNRTEDIKRCIGSLYNKEFTESVEIILIDDGSRAECANALDEIATSCTNVKVFHQSNKGVSNARNQGVTFATGEYVAFVDADDMVTKSFISDAIYLIKNSNIKLDIIYGFVEYINTCSETRQFQNDFLHSKEKELECITLSKNQKELLSCHFFDLGVPDFLWGDYYISRGSVARLVSRVLAGQHMFDETLSMGEDAIWNLELLKFAENLCIVKRCWYYYIYNPKSVTHQLSEKAIGQYEKMISKYKEFASNDKRKACLVNRVFQSINELARGYFLKPDNFGNVFIAAINFKELFSHAPWKQILCFSNAYRAGTKCLLKYVLLKMGVLLFAIKLKMLFVKND
jgi:glycosyltransferase involved in cell wall biosynthesis